MVDQLPAGYISIESLSEWDQNYNQGDTYAIARSILRYGFNHALRVRGGVVVAGNHSLRALIMLKGWGGPKAFEALGFDEMGAVEWLNWPPENVIDQDGEWFVKFVNVDHLTDAEAIAFAVADNRTAQLAEPDNAQLAKLLIGVQGQGDGLLLAAGYSDEQLAGLVAAQDNPPPWNPDCPDGDGVEVLAGYRLASMWYGISRHNDVSPHMLELPIPTKKGDTIKYRYSRTNATATERIVKTYMRPGDKFYEMCCGWMTFSSTAKYFGFSGRGGDIWDVSLDFCKRQLKAMPGAGVVDVVNSDCRETGEDASSYDFVHSNPPFFSLEIYGKDDNDLAGMDSYSAWLVAMGQMGFEAERILTPGGLANFVINDFREDGILMVMHADFINAILEHTDLVLHDLVIAEVISQRLRFRKKEYDFKRTVKCHEYVITFKK